MAMDTWNEFTETVMEYTTNGTVDDYSATMVANFIKQGSESPREQVRLSRTIKDVLSQFSDSPLNGRRASSRKSGVATLSDEAQADYADMVNVEYGDEYTTLTLRNDCTNFHTTFSGRKDDDGNPLTAWPSVKDMLDATLLGKLESGYVKDSKGGN
tara:strand:+ start:310 stop:777 length:468 start_codon:yes stop_codon:yes gene_type:complete